MAAGLKIRKDKICDFAESFEEYARTNLPREALAVNLEIDAHCRIADLSDHVVRELQLLEPFGQGNGKRRYLL